MVVFTCNHCGDSLQKPKVEKHYSFRCRGSKSLTCMDCLKDFYGEEYNAHIKCVTEEERYAAKGTYGNGLVKKGELKQELWSDMIKSILNESSNLKPNCRKIFEHIVNFTNVPRKKAKYINFMKGTMGGRVDHRAIEEVWDIIEKYKENVSSKASNGENGNEKRKAEDSTDQNEVVKVKKLKSKSISEETASIDNLNDTNLSTEENGVIISEKFDIKEEILKILNKKQSMSLVKLEKKLLKKYESFKEDVNEEKFKKRFNKKLKNIADVVIDNDIVSIKN